MPCFMLRSTFLHVHMFRSRCLGFLCHTFLCFMPLLVLGWWLGLHVHMFVWCYRLRFARIYVFKHFLPCFVLRSTFIHVYTLGFMFYHVYMLSFYMFTCMFLCLYAYIYVSTCLCAWIYALYMIYSIFHVILHSIPYSCA